MTNTEIANEFVGLTPQQLAQKVDAVFTIALNLIPEPEHLAIGSELENVGVLVNHDINYLTSSKGICKRKKNPNNNE